MAAAAAAGGAAAPPPLPPLQSAPVASYRVPPCGAPGVVPLVVPAVAFMCALASGDGAPAVVPSRDAPAADAALGAVTPALSPAFWKSLAAVPWGFNEQSVVWGGDTLGSVVLQLAGAAPPAPTAAAAWRVQHTRGVLVIDSLPPPPSELPPPPPPPAVACFKATLVFPATARESSQHRLLALVPASYLVQTAPRTFAAAPTAAAAPGAAATLQLLGVAVPAALPALAGSALERTLGRLAALLAWLRRATSSHDGMYDLAYDGAAAAFVLRASTPPPPPALLVPQASIERHAAVGAFASTSYPRPPPEESSAPAAPPLAGTKRARDAAAGGGSGVSLAIIVPFRDQPLQNRGIQLARFAEYMPRFLAAAEPPLRDFHIFVVEQAADGYKFNRGKTLNAGFAIATDRDRAAKYGVTGTYDAFCFHDVDLFPQPPLAPWYTRPPERPIHIAAVWPRYRAANYVGGALTLSGRDFAAINGFPNNMWGWGGEDDVLHDRMAAAGLTPPLKPDAALDNTMTDMEEELVKERGGVRAGQTVKEGGKAEWRCFWKKELRIFHTKTTQFEGLATLRFAVTARRALGPRVTVFTVNLFPEADPAAEKEERTDSKLVFSDDTARVYVDRLVSAYRTAPAGGGGGGAAAIGAEVAATLEAALAASAGAAATAAAAAAAPAASAGAAP